MTFLIATCTEYVSKVDKGYYTKYIFLWNGLITVFSSKVQHLLLSVECLFSIAGKVFRPERCSLKDDTFDKLNKMIKCIH